MRHLSNASLLARIFETVPYATFLVDLDVHVLHANAMAARLLGLVDQAAGAMPRRMCDLLRCDNGGREPGGRGSWRECDSCIIRGSVRRALRGDPVRRVLAFVEREEHGHQREICLQVSAAAIEHERRKLAVVTLDDVTDVYHLRSLIPLCSSCDRIRSA